MHTILTQPQPEPIPPNPTGLAWVGFSTVMFAHMTRHSPSLCIVLQGGSSGCVALYSCETWSITSCMFDILESFHHHGVARRLTHRHAFYLHHADLWVWPSITETLHIAGMFMIREYISRHHEYILPYAETHPLLAQCHQAGCGSYPNQHFWWDGPTTL